MFLAMWLACGTPTPSVTLPDCDPAPRAPGEVRARRIQCSDEILPSGEARQGDWLLENAHIRLAVRDATVSLPQLTGTGGTLLAAASPLGTDALVELIPAVSGEWFEHAEVTAWQSDDAAGIRVSGTLPSGQTAEVGYTLHADSSTLQLEGMDGITLVPMTNSVVVGDILETPTDSDWLLFAPDGEISDLGGWVSWHHPTQMHIGTRAEVYQSRWPSGQTLQGDSDGSWIVASEGAQARGRFPVRDDSFSGWFASRWDTAHATASGAEAGEAAAPSDGQTLNVGDRGALSLWVVDEDGEPLPATLTWNGRDYPWLPGDGPIGVGPGSGSGTISAGPAYDSITIPAQDISGTVDLEAKLTRQIGHALLARLDIIGAPDPTERRSSEKILRTEAAAGVQWAVLSATDEIPRVSLEADTERWISAQAGSLSGGEYGAPMTWPWSTDTDKPAHGAAPWHLLGPHDMIDVMTKAGSRRALIDGEWMAAAGPPVSWQVRPEAFRLTSLDDLDDYLTLLQHWVPITAVGPWTWIEDIQPTEASTTEAVRGILAGRTTATTGPRLVLTVNGTGPGELLPEGDFPAKRVRLQVSAAADWAPTHAAIITHEGEVAQWSLTQPAPKLLDVGMTLIAPDWVIGIAWSEDEAGPWAVTSPVWVGRP